MEEYYAGFPLLCQLVKFHEIHDGLNEILKAPNGIQGEFRRCRSISICCKDGKTASLYFGLKYSVQGQPVSM